MTTNIDYQTHTITLLHGLVTSAANANALYAEPLAAATVVDGEPIPAETEADRHATVYDRIQADLVYLLLTTAPDLAQLLDYIQFSARALTGRQWHIMPPPAPPAGATAAPGEVVGDTSPRPDDARIVWSIHPDVYFAMLEAKETL
jgi:hypothetical protein